MPFQYRARRSPWGLVGFFAICFAVAAVSGIVTAGSVHDWYPGLNKPSFNPPDDVFGPVWTTLYAMIAISGWRAWSQGKASRRRTMPVYWLQLVLNCAWSFLFFGAHLVGLALVDIVFLFLAIVATIASFAQHDRFAAWLLVPYAVWVAFAAILNGAIWHLN